jgi:hypothetical protein
MNVAQEGSGASGGYSLGLRSLNAIVSASTTSDWIEQATADELRGLLDVMAPLVEAAHRQVNGAADQAQPAPPRSNAVITLDTYQVTHLREVLLIRLACMSELDRLLRAHERDAKFHVSWPDCAIPIEQHGDDEMVSKFADALRYLG